MDRAIAGDDSDGDAVVGVSGARGNLDTNCREVVVTRGRNMKVRRPGVSLYPYHFCHQKIEGGFLTEDATNNPLTAVRQQDDNAVVVYGACMVTIVPVRTRP